MLLATTERLPVQNREIDSILEAVEFRHGRIVSDQVQVRFHIKTYFQVQICKNIDISIPFTSYIRQNNPKAKSTSKLSSILVTYTTSSKSSQILLQPVSKWKWQILSISARLSLISIIYWTFMTNNIVAHSRTPRIRECLCYSVSRDIILIMKLVS